MYEKGFVLCSDLYGVWYESLKLLRHELLLVSAYPKNEVVVVCRTNCEKIRMFVSAEDPIGRHKKGCLSLY
jgi:hypothetical protein